MNYIYNQEDLKNIKYLKENPPKKIWWDFVYYSFDYGDFYFQLETSPEIADSQNKNDEAIIGKITKIDKPYVSHQNSKIVCENKIINSIYIVRTFLYFSTYQKHSLYKKSIARIKAKLKSISGKKDPLNDILAKTNGSWEEITCHPKSNEIKYVNPKHSNLIDCGLILEIEGEILEAYVRCNGFGFNVDENNFFSNVEEVKQIAEKYELIKV
jgi:hypothetical protein